ncbi:M20 aminoacylase family protein [Pseudooceanicola nanhaiensis]|uniref:M20 aminoacylase family protein n=1 Tax=Pseudooceanicola nanhaiensis TaxID=375761 RepID=UPI001CD5478A|nr:M20 aminoacylase family protein [Pseudooceanicola nanhaiensis]MCA0919945.1 M20 family metallopeptidase [Pseudooceanicola nanhaiensis]
MSLMEKIRSYQDELTAIRRDIHAHPELGLQEHRTAALVAEKLESWGIEVHRGIGQTGVVGVLQGRPGNRAVGLRADMDALPIEEENDVPYRSTVPGVMHACGHDGHTTMLLGAAKYLAETKNFDGTVYFIFQPAEEGVGGALAMLEDKLFEKFPCDSVYGLHNRPNMPVGEFGICDGPAMAGGAFFDVKVTGVGAHGAQPQAGIDPVVAACHIATAAQSIVSRNVLPGQPAVLSITKIAGGDAYNVIPNTATMGGTARFFKREIGEQLETQFRKVAEGVAAGLGCTVEVDWRLIFAPTINAEAETEDSAAAAVDLVGIEKVARGFPASMGSEDFSFMMEKVPGSYMQVGNGPGFNPHHPKYMFNDETIPYGVGLYARIVERG